MSYIQEFKKVIHETTAFPNPALDGHFRENEAF